MGRATDERQANRRLAFKPCPAAASSLHGTQCPLARLAVGDTATVGWVLNSFSEKAKNGSKLQVTLVSIDKGSIADVNKVFSLSAGEKRGTAYYARWSGN